MLIMIFFKFFKAASRELISEGYKVQLPQAKPLSPGEILGKTLIKTFLCDSFIEIEFSRMYISSTNRCRHNYLSRRRSFPFGINNDCE